MINALRKTTYRKFTNIFPERSMGSRFVKGAFWSLLGTLFAQGLSMLAGIIAARVLGKVGYGEFGMINSTVGMFGTFAGFGLGLTATKYVAELKIRDPERTGRILGLSNYVSIVFGGFVTLILFVFAPQIAKNAINAPFLVTELRISCGLLFINALNGAQIGALSGLEAFKVIAKVNLIRGVISFLITIFAVWFYGLSGLVVSTVIAGALGWWLNHITLKRECAYAGIVISHNNLIDELDVLWKYSLPAFLAGVMVGPIVWLTNAILVNQANGYAEMGLLNAANQWKGVLTFLPVTLASSALPAMSSIFGDFGASSEANQSVEIANTMNQVVIWPISILLMFLASPIMTLYGEGFQNGRLLFILIIGGTAIGYVGNSVGTLITSRGFMWLGVVQNLTWGLVLLLITYVWCSKYGAVAIGIGTAFGYFILLNWSIIFMKLREELPKALARRIMLGGLLMSVLVIVSMSIPPWIGMVTAIPVALVSIPLSIYLFASQRIKSTIYQKYKNRNSKEIVIVNNN